MKPSTPARATDALRMEKEQKRKEQGVGPQPGYPGPFGRLLRPTWIIRWAYSKPPKGKFIYIYIYIIIIIMV